MAATAIPALSRALVKTRARFRCERCSVPTPRGHCHHRRSRSVRDVNTHSPTNLVWLCTPCHVWVHANPFEARSGGWIVSRYIDQPGDQPVHTPTGWRRFDAKGGILVVPDP